MRNESIRARIIDVWRMANGEVSVVLCFFVVHSRFFIGAVFFICIVLKLYSSHAIDIRE